MTTVDARQWPVNAEGAPYTVTPSASTATGRSFRFREANPAPFDR
jgi:hypothetical protein